MKPTKSIKGTALPLALNDVDTDQMAPSDSMKLSKRVNLKHYLFKDWREDSNFIMNNENYANASILIAKENFGCGSSREHAQWALIDNGFKAIIAASFADIFFNNCAKVGLVAIKLPIENINKLICITQKNSKAEINIDLKLEKVTCDGLTFDFKLNKLTKEIFINGLEDIDIILNYEQAIDHYEKNNIL